MYIDLYISKQSTPISEFKLIGITALHMAMKIEEVDLVALGRMASGSEVFKIQSIEKKMLSVLDYKLLPDTLNFWLESVIKFWDHFAANKKPAPLPLFYKSSIHWEGDGNRMILSQVSLAKDNMFRRAM